MSRYARWNNDLQRRETWEETVDRYWSWMTGKFPVLANRPDIREAILDLDIMPSMRSLMTAGEAADRDHTCTYNCSFLCLRGPQEMGELAYILMNGTGVGFSCENDTAAHWPEIPEITRKEDMVLTVSDSKEGWSRSITCLLECLINGNHPTWDLSEVRPAGARLKTFGGRASGPEPLEDVFRFITNLFYKRQGQRLHPIDLHDIACSIGKAIVVGGVRRSAMISLSDLSDTEMAEAKSGAWWEENSQRSLANNSAVYTRKPTVAEFMREWDNLYKSKSGERGIFNSFGAIKAMEEHGVRDSGHMFGTNPCGEITLRHKQFCNLTEVVVRAEDTDKSIADKLEMATILGTCQSGLTHLPFLSDEWKKNSEEERLLGVSLTGIWDNPLTYSPHANGMSLRLRLQKWRQLTREVNNQWAEILGISPSAAITTVKPSGTVSCLVDSASGIHPRYAKHYIRRVRMDIKDPLCQLMMDQGVPHEPCVVSPGAVMIFSFPIDAPEAAVTRSDVSAMEHLELWMMYKKHWTDHNPSVTIEYTDDEFMDVGAWVYKNFDDIQGISFLPKTEHVYQQAPFETIDEVTYAVARENMPLIDWTQLSQYEKTDTTKASQTFACSGGQCEVVDTTESE